MMTTNRIDQFMIEIREFCLQNGNHALVQKYSRFFVEGYDAYGVEQKVIETRRKIWLEEYRKQLGFDGFLKLGDLLVAGGKYEEVFLAFWFIKAFEKEFTKDTFISLAAWLENGICNWAQTDTFSMDIVSPFLINRIVQLDDLSGWRNSPSKWMRRSVPVSLIKPAQQGLPVTVVLDFIAPLMPDSEKVVHQGLGCLLREVWKIYPSEVEPFLMEWKDTCARLIIQYATEKMTSEQRAMYRRSSSKPSKAVRLPEAK
jgi:3-methyladenine DNA glycosylase AlkD